MTSAAPAPWIRTAPLPAAAPGRRATAEVELRYEDIAEDGRLKLEALPHFMGVVCWRKLVANAPGAQVLREHMIVPILSRLVVTGGEGPFSIREPVTADGAFEMGVTAPDASGERKLVLNLASEVTGLRGRTHGPPPEDAGARAHAGSVFAEHVFTRPFAPPAERKVSALPSGVYDGPLAEHAWVTGESLLAFPADATPLGAEAGTEADAEDAAPTLDVAGAVTFGLRHTDSNQHVNSLVYPVSFEEAVLRSLARRGECTRVLLTAFDIRYRKPCFAGDRMVWSLRLARRGERRLAVGTLVPADAPDAKPHCYIRAELR